MIDVDIEQQLGAFHLAVKFAAEAPIVGLFGRSGAGKTSVINAIAGITTPARGSIWINGACLFDAARGVDVPVGASVPVGGADVAAGATAGEADSAKCLRYDSA